MPAIGTCELEDTAPLGGVPLKGPNTEVSVSHHLLVMQYDGNLVWTDNLHHALWAPGTWGNSGKGYSALVS
ncbi:hypothetical protein AB0M43_00355 [Longispora sp. NPDC051575]|uniref:hypothetical protein n=1 Tax=Longispora sp. NPDC051575 TaxID=3154943 RepID=UPI00344179E1